MANTVVVGAMWGDESKGKLIDFLAHDKDVVVRWGGGSNAGHTVVVTDDAQGRSRMYTSCIWFPPAFCIRRLCASSPTAWCWNRLRLWAN